MNPDSFVCSLIRKSERAIRSAHLSLQDGDPDSAVNRSYYAMFNIARAALLASGLPEGQLPRTHRGLIEAFRIHAVQTGRVDSDIVSSLSRTEGLRLKADYTGTEIGASVAKEVVARAETFVRTVEKVFGLEALSKHAAVENDLSQQLDDARREEAAQDINQSGQRSTKGPSPEETRRQAAEDWRREYHDKRSKGLDAEPSRENTRKTEQTGHERDIGIDLDPDR